MLSRSLIPSLFVLGSLVGADDSLDCSKRNIKLWLHLDITGSFDRFLKQSPALFEKSLTSLTDSYPNLVFGASGFADRPTKTMNAQEDQCFVQGVDFDVPFGPEKFEKLTTLTTQRRKFWNSRPEEDPLSGLPYIAGQKFGQYDEDEDELRLLVVLTDAGPHYSPAWDGNPQSTDVPIPVPPTEAVTCDGHYKWLTVPEIFDPLKVARTYPLIVLYPSNNCVEAWTDVMKLADYPEAQMEIMSDKYDPVEFTTFIENTIKKYQCKAPPAVFTTTSTEKPTSTTTAESTTVTTEATTTTEPTTTTTTSTSTTEATTTTEPTTTTTTSTSTTTEKPTSTSTTTNTSTTEATTTIGATTTTEPATTTTEATTTTTTEATTVTEPATTITTTEATTTTTSEATTVSLPNTITTKATSTSTTVKATTTIEETATTEEEKVSTKATEVITDESTAEDTTESECHPCRRHHHHHHHRHHRHIHRRCHHCACDAHDGDCGACEHSCRDCNDECN